MRSWVVYRQCCAAWRPVPACSSLPQEARRKALFEVSSALEFWMAADVAPAGEPSSVIADGGSCSDGAR